VASPRPSLLVVLIALAVAALLGSTGALAASTQVRHARARHAPTHRPARCGATRHARAKRPGHAGSVHLTHRPTRRHHRACLRRRHHRSVHRHHRASRHRTTHRHSTRSLVAGPNGVCQDAELHPGNDNLERIRAATICLVNRERAAHGEAALAPNGHLQQAAQGHTQSMVTGNYFDHVGPGGQTPLQRLRDAGYIYSSRIGYEVGENIAWGSSQLGTPKAIVAAWMASPGHRANILDARFRDTGVGVSAQLPPMAGHGLLGGIDTQDFGVILTA
jgi:uncharacterized protein YkwD